MTSTVGALPTSPQGLPEGHEDGAELVELVERCLTGDDAAWSVLVARYERLVYSVALRQGLSFDDAADVTQTVFEALFQSLGQIRHTPNLAAWLVSVTQRHCWRANLKRRQETPTDAPLETVTGGNAKLVHPPGVARLDEAADSLAIVEAVTSLPEPCRTLLLSLYFDPTEPSYAEVAVRLRRPVGSIGPTRARCLESLRQILAKAGLV